MARAPSSPLAGARSRAPALAFAVAGLIALVLYYVLDGPWPTLIYDGFGLACALAFAWRALKAPRGSRAPWVLGAAGNALWFAGDALSASFDYGTTGIGSLLTPADGLYLLGYPVLTAAVLLARRTRGPARDRGVALDAAMLIVAAALPIYEFWMRTALEHPAGGTLAIIVNAAYPALDMVLLAAGIRLAAGLRGSSAIVALLGVGLLFNVVADAVYNVQTINGGYSLGSALDIGWLVGYLLWGIAALLPASPRAAPPSVPDDEAPYRRRAILLGLLVASPLSVIAAAYRGAYALDAVAVLGTLVVMIIVASIRLRDLARSGSPRWRTSAFMHGGGVVVVILAMAVTHAQSISKRRADSTLALTHTQTLVEHLQSVEDGIHAGEVSVEQGRTAFVASVADVKRALETRDPDTLAANGGGGLQRDLTDYATHAELLFDLIGRDRLNAALRMDELRVSPAYQRLEAELDRTVRSYRRSATSTAEVERTVTITLLLGGAILLMWLFRRFTATRREIERTEARARALGDSERRFAALVAGSADMLTVVDADTRVLAYPDTVERVLGKEAGSMLGARLDAELDETDTRRTRDLLDRLRHDAEASGTVDWHLTRADGSPMTAEARLTNQLDDPLLCGFVLNVRDVTARADLERELEFRAYHDHLTGLANRSQLEARLRHALTRSARSLALHAIVVINLDDFKSINDSFGHAAGDALLIEVGRRLRMRMRSNDTVARLGGDEFGILLEDVPSIDEALAATRRMLEGLRVPYEFAGRTVLVGGSAGVAVTDGAATGSIEEAAERQLRNADLAMYEAKRVGDGSVELFAPEMHVAVASRVELRAAIKKGLERGEFLLHYQPIIEFANRKIVGYEALVRWERPGHGLVPPDEFIPIAEQTGLIVELGTFVLGEATRQLAAWNARADEPRYVSVNVAGAQIQRDEILVEVARAVRESGIEPSQLLLEVTETGLIQDSEGNERRLDELRELGVRLAIDDFGTGYSSLSYLQRFSMDVLKIDKAFVDDIAVGQRAPLVEAMITMAGALDLKVIAEGIETPGQMFALQELGCHIGQGFLFSRAVPAHEIQTELGEPVA